MMPLVIVLGVLAAFLFAASASIQQRASRQNFHPGAAPSRRGRHPLTTVIPLLDLGRRLVRSRLWLIGWTINLVGFMAQAAALHFGSVALVQPLLVTQLLFTLPLAAAWDRRTPTRLDWLAGAAICGGLTIFLAVRNVAPLEGEADRWRVVLAGVSALGLVCVLITVAAGRRPLVHAMLLSVAAGTCFATSAVFIKLTATELVHHGVVATALDWPGYALALSALTGLLLEQGAFAAGSLAAAVAAMSITNPLASYAMGVLVFRVTLPSGPGELAALAGAGALISLGALGLAQSPSVRQGVSQGEAEPARQPDRGRRPPVPLVRREQHE